MIGIELGRLEKAFHEGKSLLQCLRRPDMAYSHLPARREDLDPEVVRQVEILVKYDGYMRQDRDRTRRLRDMECQEIPKGIDYWLVRSLRFEAKEKFSRILPTSLGQASRIPGITPADIYVLSIHLRTLKQG
jgi:tRNA uridine 5-carboxymethylaminomethyl modification enzyme